LAFMQGFRTTTSTLRDESPSIYNIEFYLLMEYVISEILALYYLVTLMDDPYDDSMLAYDAGMLYEILGTKSI
jgi:hypothetical protein